MATISKHRVGNNIPVVWTVTGLADKVAETGGTAEVYVILPYGPMRRVSSTVEGDVVTFTLLGRKNLRWGCGLYRASVFVAKDTDVQCVVDSEPFVNLVPHTDEEVAGETDVVDPELVSSTIWQIVHGDGLTDEQIEQYNSVISGAQSAIEAANQAAAAAETKTTELADAARSTTNIADYLSAFGGTKVGSVMPADTDLYVMRYGDVNYMPHVRLTLHSEVMHLIFCIEHMDDNGGLGNLYADFKKVTGGWQLYKTYQSNVPSFILEAFGEDLRARVAALEAALLSS